MKRQFCRGCAGINRRKQRTVERVGWGPRSGITTEGTERTRCRLLNNGSMSMDELLRVKIA